MRGCKVFIISLVYLLDLSGADYYWVGGSGDWSDITHWVIASGGTTQYGSVPSVNDLVFFDANSFDGPNQIVTISEHVFCKQLSWENVSNNPVFAGAANHDLNIYGSILLSGSMSWQVKGNIYLRSSDIISHFNLDGIILDGDLIVDLAVGSKAVLDNPFLSQRGLILMQGDFSTNTHSISAQEILCNFNSGMHQVNLSGSHIQLSGSITNLAFASDYMDMNAVGAMFILDADKSFIINTGSRLITLDEVKSIRSGGETNIVNSPALPDDPLFEFTLFVFENAGIINGSNRFGACNFSAGYTYEFANGYTQYFTSLSATGRCNAPILINSTADGAAAVFNSSMNQTCEHLRLKDIHFEGGANYTATHSRNLGNNVGWDILGSTSEDLYWVGGSGTWDDPAHWSLSSGGIGGACVPTALDNITFDINSFTGPGQSVEVNIQYVECNNMTWINLPANTSFNGTSDQSIHIQGSLTLNNNLNFSFAGELYFEGNNGNHQVQTMGITIPGNIYFDGENSSWTQYSDLISNSWIHLNQGNLQTQNYNIVCQQFESTTVLSRGLDLGTSTIKANSINMQYMGLNINSVNAAIELSGVSSRFANIGNFGTIIFDQFIGNAEETSISKFGAMKLIINKMTFNAKGVISGDMTIHDLTLTSGYKYTLANGSTVPSSIIINTIHANGDCDGYITLESATKGNPVFIESSMDQHLTNVAASDLHILGGAIFIANNSVDLGNNQQWSFPNSPGSRNLYWVGGNGQWENRAHWSLESGGPGGECIPNPLDNVFFDHLSFDSPGQSVTTNRNLISQCHNLNWDGTPTDASLALFEVEIYGSLNLLSQFNNQVNRVFMKGDRAGIQVIANTTKLNNIFFTGIGEWNLESPLMFKGMEVLNGKLNTNSHQLTGGHIRINNKATVNLENSYVSLSEPGFVGTGTFDIGSDVINFDCGNSIIEFTHENGQLEVVGPYKFHKVVFSNRGGTGTINTLNDKSGVNQPVVSFNNVIFSNSGKITGNNEFDSLHFSPGKTYTLESETTQRINDYWEVRGINCKPILLFSTIAGKQAIVEKTSGIIHGDFLILSNQIAQGGATFLAGQNSLDFGNTSGWDFLKTSPDNGEGILGKDQYLCAGDSIILNQLDFIEANSYLWNSSRGFPEYQVSAPGLYYLQATFPGGCILNDTIEILPASLINLDLGADTAICEGQSLFINGDIGDPGAIYSWANGEITPAINVDTVGIYQLQVSVNGCIQSDSIIVMQHKLPVFHLDDTMSCIGDTLRISSPISADDYLWNDGGTLPHLIIYENGNYWLELSQSGCTFRDSFKVILETLDKPKLGDDTTFCFGTNLILKVENVNPLATYQWSTGESGERIITSEGGTFSVISNIDGCIGADTVEILMIVPEPIDLPAFDTICFGDTVTINLSSAKGPVIWSDGTIGPEIKISNPGNYLVTIDQNGCLLHDSIQITRIEPLGLNLSADTTICTGDSLQLDLGLSGVTVEWSHGASGSQIVIGNPGEYIASVSSKGCITKDTLNLTTRAPILLDLGNDQTLCSGDSLILDASVNGGLNYTWSNLEKGAFLRIIPQESRIYSVTVSDGICEEEDSVFIQISQWPELDLGPDLYVCNSDSVKIMIDPAFSSIMWQDGSSNPFMTAYGPGKYYVDVFDQGCFVSDSLDIFYLDRPATDLINDTSSCTGNPIILTLNLPGSTFEWSTGTIGVSETFFQPGSYYVRIDNGACTVVDSFEVSFESCDQLEVFVPNIFSPNGDYVNDRLSAFIGREVEVLDFKMYIFDRWGNMIYAGNEVSGWDGMQNGEMRNTGSYIYKIEFEYLSQGEQKKWMQSGNFVLVR